MRGRVRGRRERMLELTKAILGSSYTIIVDCFGVKIICL
jgi:hypothetical protein